MERKTDPKNKVKCPVSYRADIRKEFYENIKNGKRNKSHYHPEGFDNAKKLCDAIIENWETSQPVHMIVYKHLQGGKTSDVKTFIETCCSDIRKDEMMFLSGDPQTSAYEQNESRLRDVLRVEKTIKLRNKIAKKEDLSELDGIKILFLDEHQMGIGENSVTSDLLQQFYTINPYLIVIAITATPLGFSDANITWVKFQEGEEYYGIERFIENGQVFEISDCLGGGTFKDKENFYFYDSVGEDGSTQFKLKDHLKENIDDMAKRDLAGIGFIRYDDPLEAKEYISNYIKAKNYKDRIEVIAAHSNGEKGEMSISQAQSYLRHKIVSDETSVIMVFTGIYRAGNDLDSETDPSVPMEKRMKSRTCFGYETSDPNLNTHLQSIPGRFCGYHKNDSVRIYARKEVLQFYVDFYNGKIKPEDLDNTLAQEGFGRSKGSSLVNPSTHARIITPGRSASRLFTPMRAFRLTGDFHVDLARNAKSIIDLGYEIFPLGVILESYLIENQGKFFKSGKENRIRARVGNRQHYKGKDYIANGKAYSNYKKSANPLQEIEFMKETGMINKEKFTTRHDPNIKIGIYAEDIPGNELAIWLCLQTDEIQEMPSLENTIHNTNLYHSDFMGAVLSRV